MKKNLIKFAIAGMALMTPLFQQYVKLMLRN